jgi:hypothetical protein
MDGYEALAQPVFGSGMRMSALAHVSLAVGTAICDVGAAGTVCNGDTVDPEHAVSRPQSNKPIVIHAEVSLRFNL